MSWFIVCSIGACLAPLVIYAVAVAGYTLALGDVEREDETLTLLGRAAI